MIPVMYSVMYIAIYKGGNNPDAPRRPTIRAELLFFLVPAPRPRLICRAVRRYRVPVSPVAPVIPRKPSPSTVPNITPGIVSPSGYSGIHRARRCCYRLGRAPRKGHPTTRPQRAQNGGTPSYARNKKKAYPLRV